MVKVERNDAVEVITLDRPERRNALDHATVSELIDALERLWGRAKETLRERAPESPRD